ncbi:transcriptional regulator [Streptococcus pyogenes]|nr:transcriptional regulator [Streptococcus pyogenes]
MSAKKTFFASNLKYLRLKKNMEQLELANLLGRKSSSSMSGKKENILQSLVY